MKVQGPKRSSVVVEVVFCVIYAQKNKETDGYRGHSMSLYTIKRIHVHVSSFCIYRYIGIYITRVEGFGKEMIVILNSLCVCVCVCAGVCICMFEVLYSATSIIQTLDYPD